MVDDCRCLQVPGALTEYEDIRYVGVDDRYGRYADVTIKCCIHCGRLWLHYFVEFEGRRNSSRYFMGLIENYSDVVWIVPEIAINYIASLDWHLYGGAYFDGLNGRADKGTPIYVDD